MKNTFNWSLVLTGLVLGGSIAFAQPNPNDGPPPPPPNGQPPRPPRETPEQRRQEQETQLRTLMSSNGVTDAPTQDAVLTYLEDELKARAPLRQMGLKLYRALGDQNISNDQIQAMIADYQNAQDLENQRRTKSQSDLDAKIHYTKNPRLQGLLLLMGVLGDGPPLMEGQRRPNQPGNGQNPRMMQRFDKNGDGTLDAQERAALQAYRQQQRAKNGNPPPPDNNQGDNPPPPNNGNQNDQMNNDPNN